jgi:predicted transcriptional regulator
LKIRSGPEIIGLILQAVEEEPLTRSKIMYQAMLNFSQVNYYTSLMIQPDLLNYSKLDRKYIITGKGRQFLALFNETSNLLTSTTTLEDDGNNMAGDNLLQVRKQQQQPPQQQEVTVHNNDSNDKRVFECGCTVEWCLDKIKFTDCIAHSDKGEKVSAVDKVSAYVVYSKLI